jgi:hypothetical protein
MSLFTVQWGGCGWYFGNVGDGSPSVSCGPALWAKYNANGYPCIRWTCQNGGAYNIAGQFTAAAQYGGDSDTYVVINGVIAYSNQLQYLQVTPAAFTNTVYLSEGDIVDFVVVWDGQGGGLYSGWTGVEAVITPIPALGTAFATATATNGYVVDTTLVYGGYGYTNTPSVRFIGGGGSGAQAVAVVSNGVVTAVDILNPGSGYTNTPLVVIAPPFIPNPALSVTPMTFLSFSNLTVGGAYQLQQWEGYYWSNHLASFTATNAPYSQTVAGVVSRGDYQLALSPAPTQAFATAQVDNGFVIGITLTSGGSGYLATPTVNIVGSGTNATAVASISSSGVVTNISITDPGTGYDASTLVEIAPPPTAAVSPTVVMPMVQLYSTNLAPYDNYQIQFTPVLGTAWENWNGGSFTPTNVTDTEAFFFTNNVGFFRLQYLP